MLNRALNYLNTRLNNGEWQYGLRIPVSKELALQADVPYRTMRKALAILMQEKKIVFKRKVGIFAGPDIPLQNPYSIIKKTVKKKTWERIKDALQKDISIGKFHHADFLPSIKELAVHYHTGYIVLKKVLDSLSADGILVQEKKLYRVKRFAKKVSANCVYLFVHENFRNNSVWQFSRDCYNTFTRTLETTCHERGIHLIKKYYSESGLTQLTADASNSLGSIVYPSDSPGRLPKKQDTLDLLKHLEKSNTPVVCIFLEYSNDNLILNSMQKSKRNFFCPQKALNVEAGKEVGRMLLSYGHKKVCFFAPANIPLFQERYQGVCSSFASSGITEVPHYIAPDRDALTRIDSENNGPAFKLMVENLKEELGMSKLFVKNMKQTELSTQLLAESDKLYMDISRVSAQAIDVPASKAHNDIIETMLAAQKMQLPAIFKGPQTNSIQEISNAVDLFQTFFPIFEQARTLPGVTAWVCAEDHLTNAAAFEYCKQKGIKIPQDLGLIGFQDHFESCSNNISSYHFDFAKTALKALSLVTHPKHSAKLFCKKDSGEFAFEGMVIDRGSA